MSEQIKSKEKIYSLQLLRLIAFTMIFVSHIPGFSSVSGNMGVSVFFILSGFLLTYNYYEKNVSISLKDTVLFSVSKIKKLYPLHFIFLLMSIVLFTPPIDMPFFKHLFANIFLVQAWTLDIDYYFSFNGVSWYLSAALFLYFMFPYILWVIRKYKGISSAMKAIVATVLIEGIITVCVYFLFPNKFYDITYIFPPFRLGSFIVGCNIGYVFLHRKPDVSGLTATLMEISVIPLLFLYALFFKKNWNTMLWFEPFSFNMIFMPLSVFLIFVFALKKGKISCWLTNPIGVYFGNMTAYAFLIHYILIKIFCFTFAVSMKEYTILKIVVIYLCTMLLAVLYQKISAWISRIFCKNKKHRV